MATKKIEEECNAIAKEAIMGSCISKIERVTLALEMFKKALRYFEGMIQKHNSRNGILEYTQTQKDKVDHLQ